MRIVVVGAGQSGLSCIKHIDKAQDLKIYLVEKNIPPFRKHLLLDWLVDEVSDSNFFVSIERLKENNLGLEVIHDKAVRINFDKKKIFLKDGQPLDFDNLVLACGIKPKRLEFSGSLKQGVHLLSSAWPPDLKKDITIFNHIIVYVQTIAGIELVLKLSKLSGKDIKVITKNLDFLPSQYQAKVSSIFKEKSIDIYTGVDISEVLGESRSKALKLSLGKFLACDVLILDTEVTANIDVVRDSPGVLEEGSLKVNEKLKIKYDFCFVCGSMNKASIEAHSLFDDNLDLAQRQARVISKNILGGNEIFSFTQDKPKEEVLESILTEEEENEQKFNLSEEV